VFHSLQFSLQDVNVYPGRPQDWPKLRLNQSTLNVGSWTVPPPANVSDAKVDYVFGFEAAFASDGKVVGPNKQRLLLDAVVQYVTTAASSRRHFTFTVSAGDYGDGTSWSMIESDWADDDAGMNLLTLVGDRQE
jgi:hypothetical protein